MSKKAINSVKLGIFVFSGLLFLVVMLYMIGRDQSLFGSNVTLRARFGNVQGLVSGNYVHFAGIEVGTVKRINILSDTLVEVVMVLDKKMESIIRKNAIASIGSDGLMGNKVINIQARAGSAEFVDEDDILETKKPLDTDEMIRTLSLTSSDISVIAANLKITISRLNNSTGLWKLINDSSIPANLRRSSVNVRLATSRAAEITADLQSLVNDIKNGKGSLGKILTDTSIAMNLNESLVKIKEVGEEADKLAISIQTAIEDLKNGIADGKGVLPALMNDTAFVNKLDRSLTNIEKGTDGFNKNMEALSHSALLRGYFRKLEKQQQQDAKKAEKAAASKSKQ